MNVRDDITICFGVLKVEVNFKFKRKEFLCHGKYFPNLLKKTMMVCMSAKTPIDLNQKLGSEDNLVDIT